MTFDLSLVVRGWSSAGPISIFAAFMTQQNSTRIPELWRYLEESPKPHDLIFSYWFINWTTYNSTAQHSLYPPDFYRSMILGHRRRRRFRKDLDLSAKFYFLLRLFIENSTANWLFRAVDDSIINFDNLVPFMRWVEARYDPLTQDVALGNCIDLKRYSYIQGGSGVIFSRSLAKKIVSRMDVFIEKLNKYEDVFLSRFLETLNVSITASTSEFFIGHDIYSEHTEMMWNNTLDLLPPCPKLSMIWRRKCRAFVSPVQDLVFWHREGGNTSLEQTIRHAKRAMSLPRRINWWLREGRPHLCINDKEQERRY